MAGGLLARFEPLFRRLDRIAGGRGWQVRVEDELLTHPKTKRAFIAIAWLLVVEFLIGIAAVVIALVLAADGIPVQWSVWMRTVVVLAMTATLFYFAWRASLGYYWGYSRLRLFSKIFPVITLVLAAIPGLYPLWMVTEQIVFSLILIGVSDYLDSDHMRAVFPRPGPRGATHDGEPATSAAGPDAAPAAPDSPDPASSTSHPTKSSPSRLTTPDRHDPKDQT